MTTINDLIAALQEVPEDKRDLPIYVCDDETCDNMPVISVSRFDQDQDYGPDNPLGIDFTNVSGGRSGVAPGADIRTEEQAMNAINSIRARFDLVGTEFGRADVEDYVGAALAELPNDVAEFLTPRYVEAMVNGFSLKALRDIIISRGNEHLDDSVAEMIGIPTDAQFGPEYGIRVVSHDSSGETLRETILKQTADSLLTEIEQAKKVPNAAEVTVSGIYFTETGTQNVTGDLLTVWEL